MHYSITLGTFMKDRVDNIAEKLKDVDGTEEKTKELQDLRQQFMLGNTSYESLFNAVNEIETEYDIRPVRVPGFSEDEFNVLTKSHRKDVSSDAIRQSFAEILARCCVSRLSQGYDPYSVKVEKISDNPKDWYLYVVAAKLLKSTDDKGCDWAAWTMNITDTGLSYGHYDIRESTVPEVFAYKKS